MSNTSITSVKPLLSVPHHICQAELAYILELRRQRAAIDERILEAETSIRTALEIGAVVELGIHQAYLSAEGPDKAPALIVS